MFRYILVFFISTIFATVALGEESIEANSLLKTNSHQNAPNDVSIKSAWDIVVQNNDGLKAQHYGLERADKLSFGAKLSYLPEINFTAAYLYFDDVKQHQFVSSDALAGLTGQLAPLAPALSGLAKPVTLLERDVMVGALNIIYPIYTGGLRHSGVKLAEIAKKDANEMLRLKKLATFEELISVYYGDVLAKDLVTVLEQNYEASNLHYQNALGLQKSGQIARLEVLASQVASDRNANRLKEAKNSYQSADLALQTALGKDMVVPISTLELSNKKLQNEEYYVQKTLASYPALQSLDLKLQSAQQTKNIALSSFMPQVAGMGSYIWTNHRDSLMMKAIPSWYVGIGVSVPIITPKGRLQKYEAAKLGELEVQSLKSQAIKDLSLLVRRTYKEAIYAREEYESLTSSVALAKENLKLQQIAFKQGLATSTQVIDAQNSLQSALVEQKMIAYKAIVALARLLALSDEIETFWQYQQ